MPPGGAPPASHQHGSGRARYCARCATPLVRARIEGKLLPRCPRCGLVVYADPKLAAGVVVERGGAVLLLRRAVQPARGLWTFPGGYVDRGEPVPEAAAREVREEAGITVTVGQLLGVYSERGNPVVLVVYCGTAEAGAPVAGPEALELRWAGPADIPWDELAFPSTRQALQDWNDRRL